MPGSLRSISILIAVLLLATSSQAQRGALTMPVNLAQLNDHAALILHGTIESARVEPHPDFSHLMTVRVTLRVQETWKGKAGATYSFRQFIWDVRDRRDAAGYRKGEDLLLFLNPVNQYGLTAPVALEQGRFRVTRGPDGKLSAINGRGNIGLFRTATSRLKAGAAPPAAMAAAAGHSSGPMGLDTLRTLTTAVERSRNGRVPR
jgi:hypothetical protein